MFELRCHERLLIVSTAELIQKRATGALLCFLHRGLEQSMVGGMKWFFVLAVAALMACQPNEAELRELEARLKVDSSRSGKVGLVVALGTRAQAVAVARSLSRPLNLDCELPSGSRRTTTVVEVSRGGTPLQGWNETRLFSVAPPYLSVAAKYRTELGQTNTQQLAWTIDRGEFLAKDPLSDTWFARPLARQDETWLKDQGLGLGQTVMDATPGWTVADTAQKWEVGIQRMTCERDILPRTAWLDRFSGRATLIEASVTKDSARTTSASWRLADGSLLQVEITEETVDWRPNAETLDNPRVRATSVGPVDVAADLWEKLGLVMREKNR